MRKIVFISTLFALLLFQSSCVRHSKCDCVDKAIKFTKNLFLLVLMANIKFPL